MELAFSHLGALAFWPTIQAMTLTTHWQYSIVDYVRLEEYSNVRHEFLDGRILAMAGGTPEHGARAAAVIAALSGRQPYGFSVKAVFGDEVRHD